MFLSKDESSRGIKTNVLSVAFPLPKQVWIYVGISFVLVWATISITGFKSSPVVFWLASVLMEQGSNLQAKWKWSSAAVLFGWMYTAIVLKHVYTSNMFTNLIELPTPDNIPATLYDLFNNSLGHGVGMSFIEYGFRTKLYEYLNMINEGRINKTFKSEFINNVVKNSRIFNTRNLFYEGTVHSHIYNISRYEYVQCVKYPYNFVDDELCDTNGRVGFVYNNNGNERFYDDEFRFLTIVSSLLGGRKYIEPLSQRLFRPERLFWYFDERFFLFENFQEFLGCMEQSGISRLLKRTREVTLQTRSLKEANSRAFRGKNWTFFMYSVQRGKTSRSGGGNCGEEEVCTGNSYESIKIVDFVVIVALFGYMVVLCVLVWVIEVFRLKVCDFSENVVGVFQWSWGVWRNL